MSNNLDWSIPVADYTPAHWAAINASEAEREARKSNYEDDDLDYLGNPIDWAEVERGEREKEIRKSYQDLYPQEGSALPI